MPLGAVVSAANVNDSVETQAVLESLVVKPPAAEVPVAQLDRRDLPHARADGAYGNRPSKERAAASGCLQAEAGHGRRGSGGFAVRSSAAMRFLPSSVGSRDAGTARPGRFSAGCSSPRV